jgi:hypothetical protein
MDGFLLDTNVVSELRKRGRANPDVLAWMQAQPDEQLYLSAATMGEIRMGIERLRKRDSKQAAELDQWAETVRSQYRSRILDATSEIFERWGVLQSMRPVAVMDAVLAATALHHNLTLVTRNTDDFRGLGLRLFNPFAGQSA